MAAQTIVIAVALEVAGWAFQGGKTRALMRVPAGATVGEFLHILRSKLPALAAEQAIYAFWGGAELAAMHTPLSHLVLKYHSKNGRIPVTVRAENTFG